MLKKTISFSDYNGNEVTKDFYFNLNKAEITKWLTTDGDYTLDKKLGRLFEAGNGKELMNTFDELIKSSYGIKSLDGLRFEKSEEILNSFVHSEAYSVLFMELVTDAKKAAQFINAIIPKDIAAEIERIMRENPEGIPAEIRDYIPKNE